MPYFVSGDINSFGELTTTSYGIPRDAEFFKKSKGFDVVINSEVIKINRENKTVTVKIKDTGEIFEHGYNKLVIATGSNPNLPKFSVPDSPRVKPFTRPADAINFRKMAQEGKIGKAVIIGGGFIGCELAEAAGGLWGIDVTLIEKEDQLLPYVLDSEMAAIVKQEMIKQDINVMTGAEVEKIELDDEKKPIVYLNNKITIDYVFLSFGVMPETKLAQDCGLEIGQTGGIKVDFSMRTSDPDIYAGGDCVESINQITGKPVYMPMGSLANRHGMVIGENLAGGTREFPGVSGAFLVKVFDINVGSVGLTEKSAKDIGFDIEAVWGTFPDKPDYYPESKTFVLKMVYNKKSELLLGLQAVGEGDICRRIDSFSIFLQNKSTLNDLLDFEHGYAPPYSEALDPLHHLASMAKARRRGFEFVSPDFKNDIKSSIVLDVREPDEFAEDSTGISNVVNIPLTNLTDRFNELDKSKTVYVICKRGPRSYQASVILHQNGFKKIKIISGGKSALINREMED
jgi:NADPH-dependent 2,4-dienoyl-CoA reductase/sulfur reductase-like enzyme/rhodanese-related sulfurtransferase